ncbi:ribbon-helix-helix protein, CopG family [Palleronia sp. THAF1]|nr:ribbon-helix-helix protein, CopG family [Palleronia sp. THAF1]
MVKLPPDMAKAIDDLRRADVDLPSRPEIIRRILAKEFGLEE